MSENFTIEYLKTQVSPKRFEHILSVAEQAKKLATIHSINPDDAELAGLLHDLTREWDFDDMLDFVKQRSIPINDDEKNFPILLHGKIASIVAREKFGIDNQDILNSVSNHTLGSKNMSNLEMIIFLSDTLSWLKESDDNTYQQIFNTASTSLAKATEMVYELTYNHFIENKTTIAKDFIENWESNKTSAN